MKTMHTTTNNTDIQQTIPHCIILAGGFGTRLQSVVSDKPKCMADVAGKPFLEYLIIFLQKQKIQQITLSVGYKHEIILDWLNHKNFDVKINTIIEPQPLGTGGAIKVALEKIQETSFVINGDTYFDVDLKALSTTHKIRNADITVALKQLTDFDRYGSVNLNSHSQKITHFNEKQFCHQGLINGGIYLINKNIFSQKKYPEKFSFEKDILEREVDNLNICGCVQDSYFIDIGIPSDYEKANADFKNFEI